MEPSPVTELLVKALKLFGPNGEHWTRGALHRVTASGEDKFCAYGALSSAESGRASVTYYPSHAGSGATTSKAAELLLSKAIGGRSIAVWNDTRRNTNSKTAFTQIKEGFCDAIKLSVAKDEEDVKQARLAKNRTRARKRRAA